MNRRNFLVRLGQAATAVAATLVVDPEQLLWTPGKKTIIDFGATKQVLPATDREVVQGFARTLLASDSLSPESRRAIFRAPRGFDDGLSGPRDIKLTVGGQTGDVTFHYKGAAYSGADKLVSIHTPDELALLTRPFFGANGRAATVPRARSTQPADFSLIEVPEDYE